MQPIATDAEQSNQPVHAITLRFNWIQFFVYHHNAALIQRLATVTELWSAKKDMIVFHAF